MSIIFAIGIACFLYAMQMEKESKWRQFDGLCASCKWMNQGESCCHCFNPNQTDKRLIQYVYWNFDCGLYEKGWQLREWELNDLGYAKKSKITKYYNGTTSKNIYYDKTT